jgi:hypothetical protein
MRAFDVCAAIPEAWDYLWKANLKRRKEMKEGDYGYSETFYLTASDVENQVRQFALEALEGKPRGSFGRAYGRPVGRKLIIRGGSLNGAVRDWLLRNSEIEGFNFGRHHISGLRFRPKGEPLAEAEKETMRKKERRKNLPRPLHLSKRHHPACVTKPIRGWRPSRAWMTTNKDRVTCERCKATEAFKCVVASEPEYA